MSKRISGIHHITAIVGDAQENVDFYAGVLGLRMTKKTINFDDPGTYHLYFGNNEGEPGTIMTFFPWGNAYRGKIGDGQVGVTAFAVPPNSLEFWKARLDKFKVPFTEHERFNEKYVGFEDPHGILLELVENLMVIIVPGNLAISLATKPSKDLLGLYFFQPTQKKHGNCLNL